MLNIAIFAIISHNGGLMVRKFTAEDIIHFPEVQILQHKRSNGTYKDYLIIKRKDFISCFVTIDHHIGIFVEQYRPIIKQKTFEVPMGKIEVSDPSRDHTVHRELAEEINLILQPHPHIIVKNRKNGTISHLYFLEWKLKYLGFEYPSPGFSDYKNYRYILQLMTSNRNFHQLTEKYELFSQEPQLKVVSRPLNEALFDEICGITRHYLTDFLYRCKK